MIDLNQDCIMDELNLKYILIRIYKNKTNLMTLIYKYQLIYLDLVILNKSNRNDSNQSVDFEDNLKLKIQTQENIEIKRQEKTKK